MMRLNQKIKNASDEKGSVVPLYVMGIMMIMFVLSLGVDLSSVLARGIYQDSNIRTAAADMSEMGASWQLKNSNSPGHFAAKTICESLRENGYDGAILVSFYEPSYTDLTGTGNVPNRIMCYEIKLEQDYTLAFGKIIDKESVSVASSGVYSSIAYSSINVWRPTSSDNGFYTLAASLSPSALSYRANNTLSSFSVDIQTKVQEMKDSLTWKYGKWN